MPHEVDDYLFTISTVDQYQMPLICLLFAPQNSRRSFGVSSGSLVVSVTALLHFHVADKETGSERRGDLASCAAEGSDKETI